MTVRPQKLNLSVVVLTLLAAGCGSSSGPYHAPAPQGSIAMPGGALLAPWDAGKPAATPTPWTMVLASEDHLYVVLQNLITSDGSYVPGGPGLLLALRPSVGASSGAVINLGGTGKYDCVNPAAIRQDGSKLYVSCTGFFPTATSNDTRGRAVIEIDTTTNAVTRVSAAPAPFQPSGIAVTPTRIWVGDTNGPNLYAIDRTTFAVVAGNDPAHPVSLTCAGGYSSVPAIAYVAGDLFALCSSSDGALARLDATSGAVKDSALLGSVPVSLAQTGDGRIAVVNSVSATVSLVEIGGAKMKVDQTSMGKDLIALTGSDAEGVAARDNFLFTVNANTKQLSRWDLAQSPPALAGTPFNTGDGSSPHDVISLDDNQVVATDAALGTVIGVDFSKAH